MGLFGGFFDWASDKLESAKDWVSDKFESFKAGVTNVWNKFSGKEKFKEAEQLYETITRRYNNHRKQFDLDFDSYTEKIEKHVEIINNSKAKIKQNLFKDMAQKMEKIKDISVSEGFTLEEYFSKGISFDSIRSKSQLYRIDFNKHKVKTTVQAVFTLGFYTRKKAKETLWAVEEEERKIDAEIEKMNAEITKLKEIEQALANVELYFTTLIALYETLLIRLDNSVNYLQIRCLSFVHKIVAQEMSIKKLPIAQIKEIEAIITASKILKQMAETRITSIEEPKEVVDFSHKMENSYNEMNKVYEAA